MGLRCLPSLLLLSTLTSLSSANVVPRTDNITLPLAQIKALEHIAITASSFDKGTPLERQQTLGGGGSSSSNSSDASATLHVYTSPDFAAGRGISIVTTEERIERFKRVTLAPGFNDDASPPPYEKRDIPGKGRGLVATKMIHRGDRIFAHTPVLIIDAQIFENEDSMRANALEAAVGSLPAESQDMFWELYGHIVYHPIQGRIEANVFDLNMGDYETGYYGVFPETSRINHDCRPNSAYYFDNNTLTHYVHAITDIPPGAEISITYLDASRPQQARMQELRETWGFNCSCSQCSLSPELARASDKRLEQLRDILGRAANGVASSPAVAEHVVSLFRLERLHATLGEAYSMAAVTNCFEGKYVETLKWANLALEAAMLDSGPHSFTVKELAVMADKPDNHSCWLAPLKKEMPDIMGGLHGKPLGGGCGR